MNDYAPSGLISAGMIELEDIPHPEATVYGPSGLVSAGMLTLHPLGSGTVYTPSGLISAGSLRLTDPQSVQFWHRQNGEKRPLVLRRAPSEAESDPSTPEGRRALVPGEFFPNETTTGVYWPEENLTLHTGSHTFTTPNQTFENRRFTESVTIQAVNITFRNCLFEGSDGSAAVRAWYGGVDNLVIEDCTVRPSDTDIVVNGIVGWNMKIIRCNVYHMTDAIGAVAPSTQSRVNVELIGSWLHDPTMINIEGWDGIAHPDGVHWQGMEGFVVDGCRFNQRPKMGLGVTAVPPVWKVDENGDQVYYGSTPVVEYGNPDYPEAWGTAAVIATPPRRYMGVPEFRNSWFEGGGGAGLNLTPGHRAPDSGSQPVALPEFIVEDCWFSVSNWKNGNDFGVLRRIDVQQGELVRCFAYNPADPWDKSTPYTTIRRG